MHLSEIPGLKGKLLFIIFEKVNKIDSYPQE